MQYCMSFARGALNKVLYGKTLPLGPTPLQIPFFKQKRYCISSNNSRPSINRLPRTITPS